MGSEVLHVHLRDEFRRIPQLFSSSLRAYSAKGGLTVHGTRPEQGQRLRLRAAFKILDHENSISNVVSRIESLRIRKRSPSSVPNSSLRIPLTLTSKARSKG
ncbi:hypothetical protein AVEN_169958-1 [Araneus ventricosus]|uniref:Uncharacterized protein n=1 Tax=Araneus ventricosus TaxID=182803 RepID=A0A4Y2M4C1_ARAVE|nr:hypothetical protein AVEN_169958-1 [Araneus ventricosus]